MANDVEIKITADGSNAEAGIGKVKTSFGSMKDSIVKNRKAIGLGMVALGAGMEGLAKSQQGLTESTRKLGNATGMSEAEIRDMATSLSNATFPLESALDLMTIGAQQGLESADALKQYANFWDTVGDATGLSADALAKSGAALAAVGVEVGNESELLGAFGLITNESTSSVQEFLDGIAKMAPEMSAMGVSVDEAAVIMTAMERELGLTARTARTEFKEALEQSETGLAGVLDQLGLTEEQLATYTDKLGKSTGVIQDNADAHASTMTVTDKLKASFKDLAFANGELIEKASVLAPIFMAAGPIMAGFSGIMGLMTPVLHGAKLAFIGLNLSMGVITLIIIGIGVAIVAAILIWKNFDTIILALKNTFQVVFDFIKEKISTVFTKITDIYTSKLGWLLPAGPLVKAILYLKDNWKKIWDGVKETFQNIVTIIKDAYTSKLGWLLPAGPLVKAILYLKDNWDSIWDGIKETFQNIVTIIKEAYTSKLGWLLPAGPLVKAILYLKDNWKKVWEDIKTAFQNIGAFIKDLYTSKFAWILPAGPLVKAILYLKDNWKKIWEDIKATFTTVSDALVGTFRSVKGTILGIWDGMVAGIKLGVNTVIGGINTLIGGINSLQISVPRFQVPDWVPGMGSKGWGGFTLGFANIPKIPEIPTEIPTLARGGIVNRPTLAMIGESGPEAVIPLGRGGGAGMTVNLVINGDINGMDDFEQKVTSVIRDAVLGGGFQGVLARA